MRIWAGVIAHRVSVANLLDKKYDGDELNMTLLLDREMVSQFSRLEPHLGVLDERRPWAMSSSVGIPSPMLSTLGNFLHRTD